MARALKAALTEMGDRQHPDLQTLAEYVKRWENGKVNPSALYRGAYARALGMPEDDLFSIILDGRTMETGHAPARQPAGHAPDEDEDMQRRRLLQALAALGVTAYPAFEAIQTIRDGVDHAVGRGEDSHLEEWEETVVEYGYAYMQTPPHQLLPDLAADLVAAQQMMTRYRGGSTETSWSRVMAALSMLMAKTLCNLGQSWQARPWWATAQQAAERSGDAPLTLWVRSEEVTHGLYDRRPLPILLRQTEEIIAQGGGAPCPGLASAHAIRAQLLAMEGNVPAALVQVHNCVEVTERLPDSTPTDVQSATGWAEDRVQYTTAWVHAYAGDRDRLDAAAERTLELLHSVHRSRTQIRLIQAYGHVRAGDVTEGVRLALDVYNTQPAEHRIKMIRTLASQVLEAVPASRRKDTLVADYRELLSQPTHLKSIM